MRVFAFAALIATALCVYAQEDSPLSSSQLFGTPAFEVATIKPSDPNQPGWTLGTKGNHFYGRSVNVVDLISFAYGLHAKQIAGGPAWIQTDKFDIEAVPNFPGKPRRPQLEAMLQKLLAERFRLTVHKEQRELAVYAIVPAKDGTKLKPSGAPADAPSGYDFPRIGSVAEMKVMHMTMAAFASALQRTVLDRPVVEESGLKDRYDFTLTWTPDESQFIQFQGTGVSVPASGGGTAGPPGLFTAIEEQLGLKLQPKKEMSDVVVVDRVDRPSAE